MRVRQGRRRASLRRRLRHVRRVRARRVRLNGRLRGELERRDVFVRRRGDPVFVRRLLDGRRVLDSVPVRARRVRARDVRRRRKPLSGGLNRG